MTAGEAAAPRDPRLGADVTAVLGDIEDLTTTTDGAGVTCIDTPRELWSAVATQVRDGLGMDFFDWLSAVDEPDGDPAGVDVVLHVADSSHPARRLLLRTRVPDADLHVDSVTGVWAGAAWHERETYEMFGVEFTGFGDGTELGLRPLLLPEGFEGTPLRKSFVLAARAVKPWPGAKEPGESHVSTAPSRRKVQPPGVPDAQAWGPREPEPPQQPGSAPHPGSADEQEGPADA